jgi:hypothetical protein
MGEEKTSTAEAEARLALAERRLAQMQADRGLRPPLEDTHLWLPTDGTDLPEERSGAAGNRPAQEEQEKSEEETERPEQP